MSKRDKLSMTNGLLLIASGHVGVPGSTSQLQPLKLLIFDKNVDLQQKTQKEMTL